MVTAFERWPPKKTPPEGGAKSPELPSISVCSDFIIYCDKYVPCQCATDVARKVAQCEESTRTFSDLRLEADSGDCLR